MSRPESRLWSLFLLGSIYMIGELGHFILGTVSRAMAQDIHYGDKGCLKQTSLTDVDSEICTDESQEFACLNVTVITSNGSVINPCTWDYTGLGLEYHILAGPAFVAVFTVAGLGWGYFADKFNRVHLMFVAALIFSVSIIATSFATKYWHVLLFRMALGLGESGCSPLASGIIADLFPKSRHGLAMSLFNWGIYIGYGISYTIGTYVTDANLFDKGWRASYMVSGIPGILLALLFLFTATEPARTPNEGEVEAKYIKSTVNEEGDAISGVDGPCEILGHGHDDIPVGTDSPLPPSSPSVLILQEHQSIRGSGSDTDIIKKDSRAKHSPRESPWGAFTQVFKICSTMMGNPAMVFLLMGACVRHAAGFCWGYNSALYFKTYYPDYDASLWLTGISIGAGAMGTLIGGYWSDRLVNWLGIPARALVLALSQLVASPFAFALFFMPPPMALVSLLLGYVAAEMWFGVMFAILVELVPSDVRSKAIAIVLFFINNFGGNMPVIVDPIANATTYRTAIILLYPGALISSSVLFFICWGVLRSQRNPK